MNQVLFWSKYSKHCKKLIDLMNQNNANIQTCCIDNKDIRKRLEIDKRIKITVVPTILSIYENGIIEKYEGEKAFDLLYDSFPLHSVINKSDKIIKYINSDKISDNKKINKYEKEKRENIPSEKEKRENIPSEKEKRENIPSEKEQLSSMTSLDNLDGEDLFTTPSKDLNKIPNNNDYEREEPGDNLPVKPSSNLSSIAANIAKNRDMMDSSIPRPTQNNINPSYSK